MFHLRIFEALSYLGYKHTPEKGCSYCFQRQKLSLEGVFKQSEGLPEMGDSPSHKAHCYNWKTPPRSSPTINLTLSCSSLNHMLPCPSNIIAIYLPRKSGGFPRFSPALMCPPAPGARGWRPRGALTFPLW